MSRKQVFKSMHDKGFLISPGDVFGGDYCLYRGTAAESHSVATVRVLEADGKVKTIIFPLIMHTIQSNTLLTATSILTQMSAREFLAFARVQNQVYYFTLFI